MMQILTEGETVGQQHQIQFKLDRPCDVLDPWGLKGRFYVLCAWQIIQKSLETATI